MIRAILQGNPDYDAQTQAHFAGALTLVNLRKRLPLGHNIGNFDIPDLALTKSIVVSRIELLQPLNPNTSLAKLMAFSAGR